MPRIQLSAASVRTRTPPPAAGFSIPYTMNGGPLMCSRRGAWNKMLIQSPKSPDAPQPGSNRPARPTGPAKLTRPRRWSGDSVGRLWFGRQAAGGPGPRSCKQPDAVNHSGLTWDNRILLDLALPLGGAPYGCGRMLAEPAPRSRAPVERRGEGTWSWTL